MNTPWTPGPWYYWRHGIDSYVAAGELSSGMPYSRPEHLIVGGEACEGAVDSPDDDPNIALIALAPEMADLILRWTSGECVSVDMINGISAMGATLRQIGVADS